MQTTRRFAVYFAYTVFIGYLLIQVANYEFVLFEQAKRTFERYPHLFFLTLYPILIGFLLALPHLLQEKSKIGCWTYDWIKAIAIGLPTLVGATTLLISFSPVGMYVPPFLTYTLLHGREFTVVSGIVFGYIVLTCWSKSTRT